jgi:hypothetical protein
MAIQKAHPEQKAHTLNQPAAYGEAVVTSDTLDLTYVSKWLWIGGAGNVKVTLAGADQVLTFNAVPAGYKLELRVSRVWAAGTTATNIVSVY